jgi:hypothetical protein
MEGREGGREGRREGEGTEGWFHSEQKEVKM